jgi:NAD(P)-dependent dehydrogenase (short-subunit alcohol dehydrogenase family)
LIAHTLAEFGRIDILINNAGFVNGGFEDLIDVNLRAAHWLTEAAWPSMSGQGYGRVLLTTSSSGLFGTASGPAYSPMQSYAATKMGVLGLGRCLAVRGRAVGIAVNMISPHAGTRLVAGLEQNPKMAWVSRNSRPDLVAPAAAYLVHRSCPCNGEIFAAGAGRVAKIFIGETTGYVNRNLTIEDVVEHFAEINDEHGYHVPEDMDAVVDLYMKTVGGN